MTTTTVAPAIGDTDGGEDRVLAMAHQILKSLKTTPKEVRADMLSILSSFDNRLSNISDLINGEDSEAERRFQAAENIIYRRDSISEAPRNSNPWEDSPDDAAEYLTAVDDILHLIDGLNIVAAENEFMDRAESAIQVAMARLEDEFHLKLTRNIVPFDRDQIDGLTTHKSMSLSRDGDRGSLSIASNYGDTDSESSITLSPIERSTGSFEAKSASEGDSGRFWTRERGPNVSDDIYIELIHPEGVAELREIADRMIRSGYGKECCQVYSSVRRDALNECLTIIGIEKMSIEVVNKIEWKALDEKMKKWIQAVKTAVRVLLAGEKQLCDQIFAGADSTKGICFNEVAKGCVMQLLNFGEAVAIGPRSSEKLFRILDMYDMLANVFPDLELMITDEFVMTEANAVLDGLGNAAKGTIAEFEKAVQLEASKKPMLAGEIHPIARYVMNYVKLLVDYGDTLNLLLEGDVDDLNGSQPDDRGGNLHLEMENMSPVARCLLSLLSCLEKNLDEKSRLYEDCGLKHIFLMNNILYIVQKVKGSELGKVLGDNWIRKRRGQIRQLATGYLRASWTKVLSFLRDEGLGRNSSSGSKMALKERFKNFNACFEELLRTQSLWKVSDPQLREELQISVSEKLIPAYRAFLGRFGHHLESGRHAGKYIKYAPDDLERKLLDFFEGSSSVMHNQRRKS